MSKQIDENVVSMQFDNRHFEKNVNQSMNTLDKLKEKLTLRGSAKAAQSEFAAYKSGYTGIFQFIKDSYNKMWANLEYETAARMKNIFRSFTTEPIMTGFSEYETQMNAIQTILSNTKSKGTTIDQVNEALDELNTYADKTIYNFTEMTKNIGTFTAAGIDLDKSVKAIQGIANLGAMSGSSPQQVANAMYQLSQALSAGKVRLLDWNSVVNAGMGGEVFRTALLETAKTHGKAVDHIIKDQGLFRDSLQEGWLTAEILTETLAKFTDESTELGKSATEAATKVKTATQLWSTLKETAQSGWTQTWELLVGDFYESRDLWSSLYEAIGGFIDKTSKARNKLLDATFSSGWSQLVGVAGIQDAKEDYQDAITDVAKMHGVAFDSMIEKEGSFEAALRSGLKSGKITSKDLITAADKMIHDIGIMSKKERDAKGYTDDYVKSLSEFSSKLKDGSINIDDLTKKMSRLSGRELVIESIKNSAQALGEIFKTVGDAFQKVFNPDGAITTLSIAERIYNILDKIHEKTKQFKINTTTEEGKKQLEKLTKTFEGLFAAIDLVGTIITGPFKLAFAIIKELLAAFDLDILDVTATLADGIIAVRDWVKAHNPISKMVQFVVPYVKDFVVWLKNARENFAAWIESLKKSDNIPRDIVKGLVNGLANGAKAVIEGVVTLAKKLIETFKKLLGIHSPSTVFEGFGKNIMQGLTNGIKSAWNTGKGALLDVIDWLKEKFGDGTMTKIFYGGIALGLVFFAKKVADGVGIITGPIAGFGEVIQSFAGTITVFKKAMSRLSKSASFVMNTAGLVNIAKAIAILVACIIALTLIDPGKIWNAVGVITVLTGLLFVMYKMVNKLADDKFKDNIGKVLKGGTLLALGIMMVLIAQAIKILSGIEWDGLARAGAGLGGFLAFLTLVFLASKLIGRKGTALVGFDSMLGKLGLCLLLMAVTAKILGTIEFKEFLRASAGLVVFGGFIIALMWATKLIKAEEKQLDSFARILGKLGLCVLLMSVAFKLLSTIKWEKFKSAAAGMLVFALFIGAIVGVSNLLMAEEHQLDSFARILGKLGWCVLLLSLSFKILSSIKWEKFKSAAAGLGVFALFIGAIAGVSNLLMAEEKQLDAFVRILGKLGLCVLLMSLSFKILGSMSWDKFKVAAAGMAVFAGFIAVVVLTSKLYGRKNSMLTGFGKTILLIGTCVLLMSVALKILGTMSWDEWKIAAAGMGIFAGFIAVFMLVSRMLNATADWKQMVATLGGIGVCMLALSASMKILGSMSWNEIGRAAVGMVVCVAFLAAAMGLMYILKSMDKFPWQSLATLAGITAILAGMAGVLLMLKNIKAGRALVQVIALSILLGALIGAVYVLDKMKSFPWKGLLTLLAVTVVLGGLGVGLWALSKVLKPDAALGIAVSLGILFGAMIIALKVLDGSQGISLKALAAIGVMIVVFGLLGLGLWLLKDLNPTQSIGVVVALTLLAGALLIAFFAFAAIGSSGLIGPAMAGIAYIALLVAEIAAIIAAFGALAQIPGLKWLVEEGGDFLQAVGTAIGQFVGGIVAGIAEGITSTLPKIGENLTNFMNNAKGFIEGAKNIDPSIVDNVGALAKAMLAITGATLIDNLSNLFGGKLSEWLTGKSQMESFGDKLAELGGALVKFSESVDGKINPEVVGVAASAAESLSKINANSINALKGVDQESVDGAEFAGKAIKAFCNQITNTEGASCAETIKALAESNLKDLGKEIKSFSKNLGKVDDDAKTNAERAGGAVMSFCNAVTNIQDGTTCADKIKALAESNLKSLGKEIKSFCNNAGTVSEKEAKKAIYAGSAITNLCSALPQTVEGFNSGVINAVANADLKKLGKNIKQFANNVGTISDDAVTSAVNGGKVIKGILDGIPSGGNLKLSTEGFADGLSNVGLGVKNFVSNIGGVTAEQVEAASRATSIISSVMTAIPNTGGIIQQLLGENNFAGIKSNLSDVGMGIWELLVWTAGWSAEECASAERAIMVMASAMLAIPNSGGIIDRLFGKNSFEGFSDNMSAVGRGIHSFIALNGGITTAQFASAEMAAGIIATVMTAIPNTGGLINLYIGSNNFESFAFNMLKVGVGVKSFVAQTSHLTKEHLASAEIAAAIIASIMVAIPNTGGILGMITGSNSFEGLENLGVSLKNFVESVKDIDKATVDTFNAAMLSLASGAIDEFIKGFTEGTESAKEAVSSLVAQSVTGANNEDQYNAFFAAGEYVASGFCAGVTSFNSLNNAYAAGTRLGMQAKLGADNALRINSPSKVFYDIGAFAGEGLVIALDEYASKSYDAGVGVGDSASEGLTNAIRKVTSTVDSGMDNTLTIRPVLDLTSVETGVKTMNGMFGMHPSVDVLSNVGSISSSMNRRQNASNNDVVDAIETLAKHIDNGRVGDTFNINGITYSGDGELAAAMETIIRAARIERRT